MKIHFVRLRVEAVIDLGGFLWISGGYMTCRTLVGTSVLLIYGSIVSKSAWSTDCEPVAHSLAIQALAVDL